MRNSYKNSLYYLLGYLLAWPAIVSAQSNASSTLLGRLQNVGNQAGFITDQSATTPQIIGIVVGAFLGFTGIVFIIITVVAGFSWMTAQGNEEKVKKAMATIKNGIIGVIISLSAWSIWNFVFARLIS